jgi:hypothetical protein
VSGSEQLVSVNSNSLLYFSHISSGRTWLATAAPLVSAPQLYYAARFVINWFPPPCDYSMILHVTTPILIDRILALEPTIAVTGLRAVQILPCRALLRIFELPALPSFVCQNRLLSPLTSLTPKILPRWLEVSIEQAQLFRGGRKKKKGKPSFMPKFLDLLFEKWTDMSRLRATFLRLASDYGRGKIKGPNSDPFSCIYVICMPRLLTGDVGIFPQLYGQLSYFAFEPIRVDSCSLGKPGAVVLP